MASKGTLAWVRCKVLKKKNHGSFTTNYRPKANHGQISECFEES